MHAFTVSRIIMNDDDDQDGEDYDTDPVVADILPTYLEINRNMFLLMNQHMSNHF